MTSSKPLFLVAALGAAAVLAAPALAAKTITVHGTGIVTSVPTRAEFTFGVTTGGKTARAALAANGKKLTKVIGVLKGQGIADADIQTAEISLSPNRNQAGNLIVGYTATNSVSALVRTIAKAGPVIDAAVGAGANDVQGPSFSAADAQLLSRRALTAAIADARARAQAIAAAAHVGLGSVVSVSEVSTNTPLPFSAIGAEKAASTPVSAGTIQTEADVTVVFAIK